MSSDEKRETWRRIVEAAAADLAYFTKQPEDASVFGRRFRERRLAECETLLAVDAILKERTAVAA